MQQARIETLVAAAKGIGDLLNSAKIPYYVVGSVAVYLHGAKRKSGNYDDIDVFIRNEDKDSVSDMLTRIGFKKDSHHYCRKGVKIGFALPEKRRCSWLPDPGCPNSLVDLGGIRVLRIQDVIRMKEEVCNDFLSKILPEIESPKQRKHFKKHKLDFVNLVHVCLQATGEPGTSADGVPPLS